MYDFEVYVNNELFTIHADNELDYQRLLTDDEFVINYIYEVIRSGNPAGPKVSPYDVDRGNIQIARVCRSDEQPQESQQDCPAMSMEETALLEECAGPSSSESSSKGVFSNIQTSIWISHSRNTAQDQAATKLLLELRGSEKFMKKFQDKKTIKMGLWKQIAEIMCEKGYNVDAEKCRQKFLNLTKKYISFVQDSKKTGNKKLDPPMFYDLLHQILRDKDKIKLDDVVDSLPSSSEEKKNNEATVDLALDNGDIAKDTKTKCKKKPYVVSKADIMQKIVDCNERSIEAQNKNIAKIMEAVSEQNNLLKETVSQRERLIDAFVKMSEPKKSKGKKRHMSTSDSD